MIEFLEGYTSKILCLAIFIGIIQMILPKGKLKQNVIFTCLIVITIVIVEPFVSIFNKDIDVSSLYKENEEEYKISSKDFDYETYYSSKLKDTYEENLRNDIVKRLKESGYTVNKIECECDSDTLEPKTLKLEIETEDGYVQPVRIEVSNNYQAQNEPSFIDKKKIEKIAYETYGIKSENVTITAR